MPFPYSTKLPPEEEAQVPFLTNIPESAEAAAGRGQDVYFLSDRPETEQFLAEKTPERPYKRVLRDVRATKPSEEDLTGMEAWKEFKEGYLSRQPGYVDVENLNPMAEGQKARQTYLEGFFRGKSKAEIDAIDPAYIQKLYREADRLAKTEETKTTWAHRNQLEIKNQFLSDWKSQRREIEKSKVEAQKPGQSIPAINPDTGKKQWYFPKTKTWGPEAVEGMNLILDAEGRAVYTPVSQTAGKAPAPKPGVERPGKKVSYVGWDKEGREVVERVDVDDTEAQSDLVGKGYIDKSKFDRMDMVDRKLAQREAMKRIGGKMSKYKDAVEVRRDYKAGKLKKEEALKILREDFGMTK